MDIERLKEYILENELIDQILDELGCHDIKHKSGHIQCANPDGDNASAVCVYENANLTVVNYTRDIANGNGMSTDIISLVEYYMDLSFPYALKWICNTIGIDYYKDFDEDLPESISLINELFQMIKGDGGEIKEEVKLNPISEQILTYYDQFVNRMFLEDGVSFETQKEFEIGYDAMSNRITIPIRDDIGNLVGVKGRYFYRDVPDGVMKFIYLERCAKSQILYGLYKTMPFIQRKNRVFVVEAEKGVLQLYDKGYCECVATGGKQITNTQVLKLSRLCVKVIFAFDKDVEEEELKEIASKFQDSIEVYALIDKEKILEEKESPTDNIEKFEYLLEHSIYRLN